MVPLVRQAPQVRADAAVCAVFVVVAEQLVLRALLERTALLVHRAYEVLRVFAVFLVLRACVATPAPLAATDAVAPAVPRAPLAGQAGMVRTVAVAAVAPLAPVAPVAVLGVARPVPEVPRVGEVLVARAVQLAMDVPVAVAREAGVVLPALVDVVELLGRVAPLALRVRVVLADSVDCGVHLAVAPRLVPRLSLAPSW